MGGGKDDVYIMDNNNNSSVEDGGNKKRKSDDISDNINNSNSITSAATHLHSLLIAKEKELKEKEEDFDKRVKLYESKHPSTGTDTDILQLNVGGSISISVRRSTLTQFPDTLLAATFSGRWDESMEKDRDGNIFIDQDPDNFLLLVNYLRLRMNNQSRKVPEKYLPKPTYPLCYMLDYYGLTPRYINKHGLVAVIKRFVMSLLVKRYHMVLMNFQQRLRMIIQLTSYTSWVCLQMQAFLNLLLNLIKVQGVLWGGFALITQVAYILYLILMMVWIITSYWILQTENYMTITEV